MTDNLGPLRQAMSDLSEHGGSADLYERSLRKSRRTQRRAALATGAAAVVVVFAVGGTVALAARHRAGPSAPPAAAPSAEPDCPTIETLGNLVELPPDWSFAPTEVQCAETWAAADVKRPTGGNVRYLFHYTAGTGWRFHEQGTEWDCQDLGLTRPAPFCTF